MWTKFKNIKTKIINPSMKDFFYKKDKNKNIEDKRLNIIKLLNEG